LYFQAVGVDLKKYKKISKWFENFKTTMEGYNEVNNEGIEKVKAMVAKRESEDKQISKEAVKMEQSTTNNEILKAVKILIQAIQQELISRDNYKMLQKIETYLATITVI